MRNGDFSQTRDSQGRLQVIYDPFTTNSTTWARTPFPGNVIPKDRQSPLSKYVFAVFRCRPSRTAIRCCHQLVRPGTERHESVRPLPPASTTTFPTATSSTRATPQGDQTRSAYSSCAIPMLDGVANFTNRPETNTAWR